LGIPAKTTFAGIDEAVKNAGRIWLIPDPDAWDKPKNAPAGWKPAPILLGQRLGKNARIVRLAGKVDDMLNAGELTGRLLSLAIDRSEAL
jgi:hypothetical protein